jgi:hypothetical protein
MAEDYRPLKQPGSIVQGDEDDGILAAKVTSTTLELTFEDPVAGAVTLNDLATTGSAEVSRMASEDKSTGIVSGGIITVNGGNPGRFDISDGAGWVVDSYSTDDSIVTYVQWTGLTNIPLTDILTQSSTFIALDATQPVPNVIEQSTEFTIPQHRDLIILGRVLHTDNLTITGIIETVIPSFDVLMTSVDFLQSFGPFNLSGNMYGVTGANLTPQKTAGLSFKVGANYHVTKKDPHRTTDVADIGLTFGYLYRDPGAPDGFAIDIPRTAYDPDIYDDNTGVLASVPNNDWTFQTLYFFPQANTHRFHLGQATYQFKQDCIDAITAEPITADPFLDTAVRRGWLVVQEGSTNLSDDNQGVFLEASDVAFGGGGSGGAQNFVDLLDVVDSDYIGKAGYVPTVNVGETGLALVAPISSAAHFQGIRTTNLAGITTTPIKVLFDSTSITGDVSFFTYSAGDLTCDKACVVMIRFEYSFSVAFGSNGPSARAAIAKDDVNIGDNDQGAWSTTTVDGVVGVSRKETFAIGEYISAYYYTLSETIDAWADQQALHVTVLEDLT